MYGKVKINLIFSVVEFVVLYKNYVCLYFNDEKDMGIIRLYYMIDLIRNSNVFIKDCCIYCE